MTEIAIRDDAGAAQVLRDTTLTELAQAAIDASMPAGTRSKYEKWWRDFIAWCERTGRTPLPATAETIANYITYLFSERVVEAGRSKGQTGLSLSTISQARWAIAKAHELAEVELPSLKKSRKAIRGYKNALAEAKDPRLRPQKAVAATADILQKLADAPQAPGLTGLRDRCMLLMWYSLGARASEIITVNLEDVTEMPGGLLVALYRKKTDDDGEVAIPVQHASLTVEAFRAWRDALAGLGRTSGPLFVRLWRHCSWAPEDVVVQPAPGKAPDSRLTIKGAEYVLKQAFQRAGLGSDWSGHSMRRGFATAARLAGHDNITIAKQTGHQPGSPVLLGYMDDADKWTRNALEGCGI